MSWFHTTTTNILTSFLNYFFSSQDLKTYISAEKSTEDFLRSYNNNNNNILSIHNICEKVEQPRKPESSLWTDKIIPVWKSDNCGIHQSACQYLRLHTTDNIYLLMYYSRLHVISDNASVNRQTALVVPPVLQQCWYVWRWRDTRIISRMSLTQGRSWRIIEIKDQLL